MAFLGDDFLVMPFDLLELFFLLANFLVESIKISTTIKAQRGMERERRMLCLSKAKNKYASAVTY